MDPVDDVLERDEGDGKEFIFCDKGTRDNERKEERDRLITQHRFCQLVKAQYHSPVLAHQHHTIQIITRYHVTMLASRG